MAAVAVGAHRSQFAYDGQQRRVRLIEIESGVEQPSGFVWCDRTVCEQRATDTGTVMRRRFSLGEQVALSARFFMDDHLRSATSVSDNASSIVARYEFSAWGQRLIVEGDEMVPVGFAGYDWHSSGAISLTLFRGYDSTLGRWLSEDPLGVRAGLNLYQYISNNPVSERDPLGLSPWYGNYCGPGSGTGAPIDELDKACQQHDKCYGAQGVGGINGYSPNVGEKNCELLKCDNALCDAAKRFNATTTDARRAKKTITYLFCNRTREWPAIPVIH